MYLEFVSEFHLDCILVSQNNSDPEHHQAILYCFAATQMKSPCLRHRPQHKIPIN